MFGRSKKKDDYETNAMRKDSKKNALPPKQKPRRNVNVRKPLPMPPFCMPRDRNQKTYVGGFKRFVKNLMAHIPIG